MNARRCKISFSVIRYGLEMRNRHLPIWQLRAGTPFPREMKLRQETPGHPHVSIIPSGGDQYTPEIFKEVSTVASWELFGTEG